MSNPSVSVVLAVYNGLPWLPESLASLRRQTFTDFEVVLIDDGSTDGTAAVLAETASADARFRIITQANRGLVASLNRGIAEARGSLIARIDSDDIAEPGRLEAQVEFMRAHPKVAVVGSAIRIIDQDGVPGKRLGYPCKPSDVAADMARGCALAHSAVMMRRDVVQAVGGYRESFRHAEDYDLWLRLAEKHELANLPPGTASLPTAWIERLFPPSPATGAGHLRRPLFRPRAESRTGRAVHRARQAVARGYSQSTRPVRLCSGRIRAGIAPGRALAPGTNSG